MYLSLHETILLLLLLLLLLEALQLQRSFGHLNEFLPFGPVSDAVLPVCYFHPCYIALYIILPSIFKLPSEETILQTFICFLALTTLKITTSVPKHVAGHYTINLH